MGSLDQNKSSQTKRQIKIVNITGQTPTQIETAFNTSWGNIGWCIIQVFAIGINTYMLAEKES